MKSAYRIQVTVLAFAAIACSKGHPVTDSVISMPSGGLANGGGGGGGGQAGSSSTATGRGLGGSSGLGGRGAGGTGRGAGGMAAPPPGLFGTGAAGAGIGIDLSCPGCNGFCFLGLCFGGTAGAGGSGGGGGGTGGVGGTGGSSGTANGGSCRMNRDCQSMICTNRVCQTPACGDGACNGAESTSDCTQDCGSRCGDGAVNGTEICDPCPTSCSDGNSCTTDGMTGSASSCDLVCTHTMISACTAGDSCCPAACTASTDSDCSSSCGNSVVEPGETCDPASTCPTTCDDSNACTTDGMTGSAANCNLACTHTAVSACTGGDGCCPGGCSANDDSDCSATCGNGAVESGETCDPISSCPANCDDSQACTLDMQTGSAANCNIACSHTAITACSSGDGCCPAGCNTNVDSDCSATCGNGAVEPGETCDPVSSCPANCDDSQACTVDMQTGSAASCNIACSHTAISACSNNGDGCCPAGCNATNDSDCSAVCGNGVIEAGETCDVSPAPTCPTNCDDSQVCTVDALTGSAASCNAACTHTPISACTNGDGCCPNGCNANDDSDCSPSCGNGVMEPGETCDPPNSCPLNCDDSNACTDDVQTGSAGTCNVACTHTPISVCANDDGCCPSGCTNANDNNCP